MPAAADTVGSAWLDLGVRLDKLDASLREAKARTMSAVEELNARAKLTLGVSKVVLGANVALASMNALTDAIRGDWEAVHETLRRLPIGLGRVYDLASALWQKWTGMAEAQARAADEAERWKTAVEAGTRLKDERSKLSLDTRATMLAAASAGGANRYTERAAAQLAYETRAAELERQMRDADPRLRADLAKAYEALRIKLAADLNAIDLKYARQEAEAASRAAEERDRKIREEAEARAAVRMRVREIEAERAAITAELVGDPRRAREIRARAASEARSAGQPAEVVMAEARRLEAELQKLAQERAAEERRRLDEIARRNAAEEAEARRHADAMIREAERLAEHERSRHRVELLSSYTLGTMLRSRPQMRSIHQAQRVAASAARAAAGTY